MLHPQTFAYKIGLQVGKLKINLQVCGQKLSCTLSKTLRSFMLTDVQTNKNSINTSYLNLIFFHFCAR